MLHEHHSTSLLFSLAIGLAGCYGCSSNPHARYSELPEADSLVYYIGGYVTSPNGDTLKDVSIAIDAHPVALNDGYFEAKVNHSGSYAIACQHSDYKTTTDTTLIPKGTPRLAYIRKEIQMQVPDSATLQPDHIAMCNRKTNELITTQNKNNN